MTIGIGQTCYFKGYAYDLKGADPIFQPGDVLAIAKVEDDGVLHCFPIDGWGRVYSMAGDTIFSEEVLLLPFPPIPAKRFPRPYGTLDNERAKDGWSRNQV